MNGALSGITAAVVGVVLNLSVWFGLNAMFGKTNQTQVMGAVVPVPDPATADWFALALAALSFLAMKYVKLDMIPVLIGCAAIGFFWKTFM
jgi:chromate transporter